MSVAQPPLTVGVPVYNGELYLSMALQALAQQSFADFKVIIGDNASTDATEEIARGFVRDDSRFEYVRHPTNVGGAQNSNILLDLASSRWFKWAYHDDICEPNLLADSVALLRDAEAYTVASFPRVKLINHDGTVVGTHDDADVDMDFEAPAARLLFLLMREVAQVQFGVIDTAVLRHAGGVKRSIAGEFVMPATLALHGRLRVTPDAYVRIRQHEQRAGGSRDSEMSWINPRQHRTAFPYSRLTPLLVQEVRRAQLSSKERRECYIALSTWWRKTQIRPLVGDIVRLPRDLGLAKPSMS